MPKSDQRSMLFMTFFLLSSGNKYHVNCAASAPEPVLRFWQDNGACFIRELDNDLFVIYEHVITNIYDGLPQLKMFFLLFELK